MNRKHDPWVSLIALLVGAILLVFCLTGCSGTERVEADVPKQERFTMEQVTNSLRVRVYVITDNQTGIEYLWVSGSNKGGLTRLEPAVELPDTNSEEIEDVEENEEPTEDSTPVRFELTETERNLIKRVVMGEAGNQPFEGQMAVAETILNSCELDGLRPAEVIEKYSYTSSRPEPTESVSEAVAAVFDRGESIVGSDVQFFYAPARCTSIWHESQRYVMTIADHKFFAKH